MLFLNFVKHAASVVDSVLALGLFRFGRNAIDPANQLSWTISALEFVFIYKLMITIYLSLYLRENSMHKFWSWIGENENYPVVVLDLLR